MHAVVRAYSGKGAKELFALLTRNKQEIERLLRAIEGFSAYTLATTEDGGFTVSVFRDKAGADESVRVARDWVGRNAAHTGVAPPHVLEGTVILEIT